MTSTRVRRFDFAPASSLAPPVRLDNGWLRVDGRISRVGVQVYQMADGTQRRELRLPDDVFDAASLQSFDLVPVTNLHPSGLLDAVSTKAATVGMAGGARRDGDYVAATLKLTDAGAIAAAEAGRSQLSCGYTCQLDAVPGAHPEFGAYDVVQRQIRGNHVALVDVARAGAEARIRLDAGDAVAVSDSTSSPAADAASTATERPIMANQIQIDGVRLDATDANAPAIQTHIDKITKRADAADAAKVAAERATETERARADAEKRRADEAEMPMQKCDGCDGKGSVNCDGCGGTGSMPKAAKSDGFKAWRGAVIAAGVTARVALEVEARKHLGAEAKLDALDADAVKRAVVEKLEGVKLDGQSAIYVEAAYDLATARANKAPSAIDRARGSVPAVATNADSNDPRAAYAAKQASAFKRPQ